jgi:type I restriction enzyme S subunit
MKSENKYLHELITHKKGFAFKSKDYVTNGVPVIRVSNFTDDTISNKDLKFVSTHIGYANKGVALQPNDIVIATVGSWPNNPDSVVGRTIIVPNWASNALMNQNAVILRVINQSEIDQKFIYYQMKTLSFSNYLISKAQGSANQASITLDAIFSYSVYWPSELMREYIVSILSTLDDRITLLRETNTTLEAIAQALFKSWFIDFDPVYAKMQGQSPEGMDEATAALFPDSFDETESGPVPKGWDIANLGSTFILTMGQSPPGDTYNENELGLPFYQGRTDFGFRFPAKRIYCRLPTRFAKVNDTLVSVRAPVGDVNMAIEDSCIGRGVASVRHPNNYAGFTFYAMKSLYKNFRVFNSEGTVFGSITKKDFESIQIINPPKKVLENFDELTLPIDQKITMNEHLIRTLILIRDNLLPQLISGKISLNCTESTNL